MSIRTNPMKAVPLLQRRLTTVKSNKENEQIAKKFDNLMFELNNVKDLFSIVKRNKEELLDTLTSVDNLLRNINTDTGKLNEICNRILHPSDPATEGNQENGIAKISSSQETQDNKSVEKDVSIDLKLQSLKLELEGMKEQFSKVTKNEEALHYTLRAVEDLLRNVNAKNSSDSSKPEKEANQGKAKTASSQETQDNKIVEKDVSFDVKLESLKLELEGMKEQFSKVMKNEEALYDTLRAVEDLLHNFNAKNYSDTSEPKKEANQGIAKTSSSQETQDNKSVEKVVSIDVKLESLKLELEGMKEQFSKVKKNEEALYDTIRAMEDLLHNFNAKNTSDSSKPEGEANQVIAKTSSSQETQDNTSVEKDGSIDVKLESLKLELEGMREQFSKVKKNEEALSDTLRAVEDLLRNFNAKTTDSSKPEKEANHVIAKMSSSQETQDNKSVEKDVSIDVKLESLKLELEGMKEQFSKVKKNEDALYDTLRAVEDLLRNFSGKNSSDSSKPEKEANQGIAKTFSSQETQDNKSVEKYVSIDVKLESFKLELEGMKEQFSKVKKNEEALYDILRAVEDLLRNFNEKNSSDTSKPVKEASQSKIEVLDQVLNVICNKIKDSSKKLQPTSVSQSKTETHDDSLGQQSQTVRHPTLPLSKDKHELMDPILRRIQVSYDVLNLPSRVCLLSLSIFPENVVIKKRHTIYWWIGEGFVKCEEEGENVFDELLDCDLILPQGNSKCPIVNKFKINPWVRHMLVSSVLRENNQFFGLYSQKRNSSQHDDARDACFVLDQQKVKISDEFGLRPNNLRTIFNVGASYLSFGRQWSAKMKKLVVLQLGRWQESPSHHIEVESVDFVNDLKDQKHLRYLSLRGISRISELPPSITQLISLEILDLKACHNLETLPNEIASLKKLTHLDVSQCYLLESMPKGIEKLIELQVLKGFVIGSSRKTPCRISDLAKLKKLKRLSIHIGSEAVVQDEEFERLQELKAIKCLKISWGVLSNPRYKDINIVLPSSLEKLDLEGYPREAIPEWLKASKLPRGLKKLYIKGGKFTSIDLQEKDNLCCVEIVRLKYLNHLNRDPNLQEIFPSLKYGEKRRVLNQYSFSEWSIDEKSESMSKS